MKLKLKFGDMFMKKIACAGVFLFTLIGQTSIADETLEDLECGCENLMPVLNNDIDDDQFNALDDQFGNLVDVNEMSETMIKQFWNGEISNIIVTFPKGMHIPLQIFLNGNILHLKTEAQTSIEVLQTFYVCFDGSLFIFSHDLTNWNQFFDFLSVNSDFSMNFQHGVPAITLGAEVNTQGVGE